jgi:putative membrane protein
VGGGSTILALCLASPAIAGGSAATADPTSITKREVVSAKLDATGTPSAGDVRVYSQLVVTGDGTVSVVDPTATDGLRNLDGFRTPSVQDGSATWTVDVDGRKNLRTVADYTQALPVTVKATYLLDGREVEPAELAGKTGRVTVQYTVTNVTAKPTEITYKDGFGNPVTKTVDVPVPYVGSLGLELPASASNIDAPFATVAGNGKGGTVMSWTMVLFAPLGAESQTFTWEADIADIALPATNVQVAPVLPENNTSLKNGLASYEGGAQSGIDLTQGAMQLDENMLKLVEGTSELMAGLQRLQAGAAQLSEGLNGSAKPGADQLAAGAGDLANGLNDSAKPGADALAAGAGDLATGLNDSAKPGADALAAGAGSLAAGIGSAKTGSDAIAAGTAELSAGLTQVESGLARLADQDEGLANALVGIRRLQGAIDQMTGAQGLPAAIGGIDQVIAGLSDPTTGQKLGQLIALSQAVGAQAGNSPESQQLTGGLQQFAAGLNQNATAAVTGLTQIKGGLTSLNAGLKNDDPGKDSVDKGLGALYAGVNTAVEGIVALHTGVDERLLPGAERLSGGTADLATGLGAAADGSSLLANGAGDLASGLGDAADGSSRLADGAGLLADGLGDAASGSSRLADGAGQLADGLGDAASGSQQLADGAVSAADGSGSLADGATRLQQEGTSVLIGKGNETTLTYAEKVAVMHALGERAAEDGMPVGAPEGAQASAAYKLTLAPVDTRAAENASMALLAGGVLTLGLAAGMVARRRRSV